MDTNDKTIDELADLVNAHPDYRVLKAVKEFPIKAVPEGATQLKRGLVLDLETTSLDVIKTEIIEIGMILFEYTRGGFVVRVLDDYHSLRDPGVTIPEEATAVNHITQSMVVGHNLDSSKILDLASQADLVIAHNCTFDRKVVERFFPAFEDKAWGCSYIEVPWKQMGIGSANLEYLLSCFGLFIGENHRAFRDCLGLLHLLAQPWETTTVLGLLLKNARRPWIKLWAVGSPIATKDILHTHGYRWNTGEDGRPKAWWKELPEEECLAEKEWLTNEVYGGSGIEQVVTMPVTANNRFSLRG